MSKVKICGLMRREDIAAVNLALPDYIGFVFAPSRRRIDIKTASMLKELLDPKIKAVGVFVNEDIRTILEIAQSGIIDLIQLHGDEDEGYISRIRENCDCPVIKSVGVCDALPPLPRLPDYLLFDTASAQRGGTGRTFDWQALKEYRGIPYFLAGGLSSENAADVIRLLSPLCVDVSSGVETDGFKDPEKINEFVQLVRRLQ